MKFKIFSVVMAMMVATFVIEAQTQKKAESCTNDAAKKEVNNNNSAVTFYISNMHGEHCQSIIEKNIGLEKGVKDLKFDLEAQKVTVVYNAQKTNIETLKKAFEKLGYETKALDSAAAEVKQVKAKCCASK
ncbi:MAG: heavy-metal-associated domain-containing protein [Prevotellaceae bacterium]|jgi:copper chaperone CopZ|nr:heavy-metal-associated domain-containing protein [Prevotellaceae bacterium]